MTMAMMNQARWKPLESRQRILGNMVLPHVTASSLLLATQPRSRRRAGSRTALAMAAAHTHGMLPVSSMASASWYGAVASSPASFLYPGPVRCKDNSCSQVYVPHAGGACILLMFSS